MNSTRLRAGSLSPETLTTAGWAVFAAAAGMLAALISGTGIAARIPIIFIAAVCVVAVMYRYELGAPLMLLALPLDTVGRIIESPVAITLYQLILMLTLASFGWAVLTGRVRARFSAVDAGWGALVFAAMWSLPFSLDQGATTIAIARLVFLWAFTFVFTNIMDSRARMSAIASTVVATGVLTSLICVLQLRMPQLGIGHVVMVNQGGGVVTARVSAFFSDPNYLAGFLVAVVVIAMAMLVSARTWKAAAVWGFSTLFCLYALSITLSRTGYVGIAVAALVLVIVASRERRRILLGLMVAGVLAVVIMNPTSLIERVASIGDVQGDASIATRVYMFGSALEIARDNWAVGTGLAAFEKAYPTYRALAAHSTVLKPHELPVALVAEMGIAGLLAELALMVTVGMQFMRRRSRAWTEFEAMAAAGIAAMLVMSLFQYYLYFEYLWLFVALAVASNRVARREERESIDV